MGLVLEHLRSRRRARVRRGDRRRARPRPCAATPRRRRLPRRRRGRARRQRPGARGSSRRASMSAPGGDRGCSERRGPPILELSDLSAGYDNVPVVRGLSLSVRAGEVVALLGANGAGKTTTLRAISGPRQGHVGHRAARRGRPRRRLPDRARAGRDRARSRGPRASSSGSPSASTSASGCDPTRGQIDEVLDVLPGAAASCRTAAPDCSPAASSRCSRSPAR